MAYILSYKTSFCMFMETKRVSLVMTQDRKYNNKNDNQNNDNDNSNWTILKIPSEVTALCFSGVLICQEPDVPLDKSLSLSTWCFWLWITTSGSSLLLLNFSIWALSSCTLSCCNRINVGVPIDRSLSNCKLSPSVFRDLSQILSSVSFWFSVKSV